MNLQHLLPFALVITFGSLIAVIHFVIPYKEPRLFYTMFAFIWTVPFKQYLVEEVQCLPNTVMGGMHFIALVFCGFAITAILLRLRYQHWTRHPADI